MLFLQFIYIAILILIGTIVLSLRRKAEYSRTGYKLVLILMGILLGITVFDGKPIISFDSYFLQSFSVFLLIVLLFELSMRLNTENVTFTFRNVTMFFGILAINILVLGIVSSLIISISFIYGIIFAILLSSVEYFLVDQLKGEGDLANPLIILFAFSILMFYTLDGNTFENSYYFLKYIILGLGVGVIAGIIVFRSLKDKAITFAQELGMVAVAVLIYIITEQMSGSGLFAVMMFGIFFGNSFVKKTSSMKSFSPKIFKTLEMLIYLLIGFVVTITFDYGLWWRALVLFAVYVLLRLLIMHVFFKHYSFGNKLLLSLAPKGMILGSAILVLGVFNDVNNSLIVVMLFILIYSLTAGTIVEYIEQKKTLRLDKVFKLLTNIRFGRKRDLFRRKRTHYVK